MTVGVVAYQGDFQRHAEHLKAVGARPKLVRERVQLEGLDALVIPGGESTTIGMLLERFGLLGVLSDRIAAGFPVFGTCAGAILLADRIAGPPQPRIGGLPVTIERNAYGRQVDSFEADMGVDGSIMFGKGDAPVRGIFIRAPIIVACESSVQVLLEFEERPVLVRSGRILAATFHPELTDDFRIHRYFCDEVAAPPARA